MADAVGGFMLWVGLFMSFGFLGLAACCFVAREHRSAWLRLESTRDPKAGLGPACSPHRSAEPPVFGYKRSIMGIHGDARRVAWRLAFIGGLVIPGTMLGLLGLLALGAGLMALPVIIIAIRSSLVACQLLRADARFLKNLKRTGKNLRFAGFWSLAVVGGFMCLEPLFLFCFTPVVLAALLAFDTARLLPRAAQDLRANLRTRGLSENESTKKERCEQRVNNKPSARAEAYAPHGQR